MNPRRRKRIYRANLAKKTEVEQTSEQQIPVVEEPTVEQPVPVAEQPAAEPVPSKKKKGA
jgi:hypothetical protein